MQLLFDFIFLIPEFFLILSFINLIFFFSVVKTTTNQTYGGTPYLIYAIKFLFITLVFTLLLNLTIYNFMSNNIIFLFFMTLKKSTVSGFFQVLLLICAMLYTLYLLAHLEINKLTDLCFEYIYILILNI